MPMTYTTPGVYREEIFLQPEAKLPTGIPGFVGFADAITQAKLENLPSGIKFPDSLKDRISYDTGRKLLIFTGVMSLDAKNQLLALSSDELFKKATEALFEKSQASINSPLALQRQAEFTNQFIPKPGSYLADAVLGFFENGGTRCFVVLADASLDVVTALKNAIASLAPMDDMDLIAVPDVMAYRVPPPDEPTQSKPRLPALNNAEIYDVQHFMLRHCATHSGCFALLDALPSVSGDVRVQQQQLMFGESEPINGALYYPWLKNNRGRFVPPCGHVAGIYARSDRTRGVFKAPANEQIGDALDLEVTIDNATQGSLNQEGINCLRAFKGRGLRVWGARTLSRDRNWRYVNVRRLFLTLGRWIDRNMLWATLEPNSPRLWVQIQRELTTYLTELWQAGALQGQTPSEAFYIKCDAETNPPETRNADQVITEIGLAPDAPAEFVIVRIIHRAGTSEISP